MSGEGFVATLVLLGGGEGNVGASLVIAGSSLKYFSVLSMEEKDVSACFAYAIKRRATQLLT